MERSIGQLVFDYLTKLNNNKKDFPDFLPRIHYNLRGVEQIFWFLLSTVFG